MNSVLHSSMSESIIHLYMLCNTLVNSCYAPQNWLTVVRGFTFVPLCSFAPYFHELLNSQWTGSRGGFIGEMRETESREMGGRAWLSFSFKCGFTPLILPLVHTYTSTHTWIHMPRRILPHASAHIHQQKCAAHPLSPGLRPSEQSPTALWVTSTQTVSELYAETLSGPFPVAGGAGGL